ncbi:fumarylacetoacetate hydrolase family protein [Hydrogenophaga sp.]|uniref:fumarylacetoacetate hydrolase family protein n=1 Tax=Hydrogenophaga sp. TaxID=1904254 RepID=UPI00272313B3|nr:fumarylacetoacetate hydrolase family protein [Hydrogenophaga sp.]MDO9437909.1 fumarylacetoacetate hydrolase family protein [Hydrogenophaga sp.]
MRLFSYLRNTQPSIGVITDAHGTRFVDLAQLVPGLPGDMTDLLALPGALSKVTSAHATLEAGAGDSLEGTTFLPLVPRPGKVVCMGLNYADHAREGGNAIPDYPAVFLRGGSSQVAHGQPLIKPRVSDQFDYEAELAVVIGKTARHLTPNNALDCVAGYSAYNDASVRDYQRKSAQWTMGKNFDGTGAFGPWLVTPDELPPGANGLKVQTLLDGEVMQNGNTRDFIWSVSRTLEIISECMTLHPGDVVITGTPAGVGYARKPPVFLKEGNRCDIVIEGIGTLSNPIRAEA